ncbi:MAG: hypothetical protein ACK53F_04790 [Betaproteobacteria bacterium]
MKSITTLTNQTNMSAAVSLGSADEPLSREQLVELLDTQLAAIGGGHGDMPCI